VHFKHHSISCCQPVNATSHTTNQHVEKVLSKGKKQRERGEEKGEKRRRKGGIDDASYSFVILVCVGGLTEIGSYRLR
jgi:hypothetical protein